MKIECKSSYICIKSNNPKFKYKFGEAGVPINVEDAHAEKILLNTDFYESYKDIPVKKEKKKKEIKTKSFNDELIEINGIGEKTVKDILVVFPTKGELLEAISKNETLPFQEDVVIKLKEEFVI